MLTFKANYGYNPGTTFDWDSIIWTDIDSVYTIGEIVNPTSATYEGTATEVYNFVKGIAGNYADAFYAIPYISELIGDRLNNFNRLLNAFPSIPLACKNAYSATGQRSVMYLPELKKAVFYRNIFSTGPGAGLEVYTVDNGVAALVNKFSYARSPITLPISSGSDMIIYGSFIRKFDGDKIPVLTNDDLLSFSLFNSKIGNRLYLEEYYGTTYLNNFNSIFAGAPINRGPVNPYEPGGPSGPTDPDLPPGTFDDESDTIPDSPLPTLSAANTGFTRIYNPTLSQVQALARYLWTDESVIETIWNHIKQFFENPMEAIIGFNLVPVPVPDGGTENFALMYIDTGVSMTVAANQFVDLDCGTVELKRYYGSALDQSPYTKVSCFLPYIGTVNLNTDEVMGTTLQVKYRVDIVSGSCVAKIFVDGNCLYQYSGHCAITIPISSADFSSYVSAAISVGKLAAAAITAGAGAAMAGGVAEASQQTNQVVTTTQVTNTARNPSTGRQITTGTTTTVQTRESPADQSSTQASFSGLSPQNVANTVGAIMSSKPHIEHSGSFSGNSGYLGVRRPFLIIERPNMCMPANYQALNGFPAMITMELSTCKGFTRVQQVQLTGMGRATNPEQAEILELLKSGVIL